MDELPSTNVQVVLSILEGRGFRQVQQPTLLVATLNGHCLESNATDPTLNHQYATDLIWESDKAVLRKMRSGHTPLKVECFAIKDNGYREKIGYILLSIRSAQIIPRNSDVIVKKTWHNLSGLRSDLKADKPELLLALTIEDRKVTSETVLPEVQSTVEENIGEVCDTIVPSLLRDECLVQLGPVDSSNELLLLTISPTSIEHVELLLEKYCDVHANDTMLDNLSVWYHILGNKVQLKSFQRKPGDRWVLSEKVVVRIRTSLQVLKNYLSQHPYLFICLKCKDCVIGKADVDLRPLVPIGSVRELLKLHQDGTTYFDERCIFYCPEVCRHSSGTEAIRPYADLHLELRYAGIKLNHGLETVVTHIDHAVTSPIICSKSTEEDQCQSWQTNFNEIASHRNPGGDFGKCIANKLTCALNLSNECRNINKPSVSCEILKNQLNDMTCSHSAHAVLRSCDNRDCSRCIEAYNCYCLHISLLAIKFSLTKLTIRNVEFRFVHPKAEAISVTYPKAPVLPGKKVELQDVKCKMHFISTPDKIRNLLLSIPPKIQLCDPEDDEKVYIAQTAVDIKCLIDQNESECHYEVPISDFAGNKIGDIDILLKLEEYGSYYARNITIDGECLGPPIMDDELAFRIVDELETWKERQKELFIEELRGKEDRHLNLLSDEWYKRKEDLESKLAYTVEQCKMLANKLNNATEDLRTRRLRSLEKEARLIKANEVLQRRHENNVEKLKESYRMMDEELMSKLKIVEDRNCALVAQVETVTLENSKLRALMAKQTEALEVYQKASLTQDQTATLLQELKILEEKLGNAQKSKSFFKEQWGKAVREIHRIKMENQQAVEVQIKNSKEELKNLELEDVLCADSAALTSDQILLNHIQKEIDVIRPPPSFRQKNAYGPIFDPHDDVCPKIDSSLCNVDGSMKPDEHDERLGALIEERDSLMKTGSYTTDDTVIVKLNTEIRCLLLNN